MSLEQGADLFLALSWLSMRQPSLSVVAEQNHAGVLDVKVLAMDVMKAGTVLDGVGFQQFQYQRAGLLVQLVVVAGVAGQRVEAWRMSILRSRNTLTCFSTRDTALPEAWEICR